MRTIETGLCWAMCNAKPQEIMEDMATGVAACNEPDISSFLDCLGRALEKKYGPSLEEALNNIGTNTGWYGSILIRELHKRL